MKKLLVFMLLLCSLLAFTACDYVSNLLPGDDTSSKVENNSQNENKNETNDSENNKTEHKYLDFNNTEKNLFSKYLGTVIPFVPCDEYYVEGYNDVDDYENGMKFYTVGNTLEEYGAYLNTFVGYTLEAINNVQGVNHYVYTKGDVEVEVFYHALDGKNYIEVLATASTDKDDDSSDTGSDSGSDSGSEGGSDSGTDSGETSHTYTDFTADEKELISNSVGFVIPFIPCEEYYVEEYIYDEDGYSLKGINFYTFDNTEAEFESYLEQLNKYTFDFTEEDEDGDTWYCYSYGEVYIDVTYYYYEGDYVVDMYVYFEVEGGSSGDSSDTGSDSGSDSGSEGGSDSGTDSGETSHTYTDFTADEKELISNSVGFVIPFIPCEEYYVEEYVYDEDGYSLKGINFYTFDNTEAEFEKYLEELDKYTFDYTEEDEYGDTWYCYSYGEVYIDIAYYYYEGDYVVDIYVYFEIEDSGSGDSGNTGSGSGSGSGSGTTVDMITNEGKGLPEDSDGVFDIDFTDAEYVKDVTDQGYYIDGCPTTGSPAVLVIPVEFSDSLASSKGYTTSALVNAFSKNGVNDYYSVYDYYYISSYGKLDLDITVLDFWFKPKNNSSYYYKATYDYYGEEIAIGDQLILDEALAYLADIMDLSKFDSDNNGIIDAVVLVNTLDIGEEDFYWAYRYWNLYTDDDGYYYEYDGVSANDYVWASYKFLNQSQDDAGNEVYNSKTMNPYVFIHEFSHILGVDDYYDTGYKDHPLDGYDVMDECMGDHNAYTKINLGWITTSRLVVTDSSITLTLNDFSKTGDTIIIANNWDEKLGACQEYYVIMYYKNEGLNAADAGYFPDEGILVYHVNASLYIEEIEGEDYYFIYNTNTSPGSEYGTENNLIEFVKSSSGDYVYLEGYTMPSVTDDFGNKLGHTFTVVSISDDYATITFSAC